MPNLAYRRGGTSRRSGVVLALLAVLTLFASMLGPVSSRADWDSSVGRGIDVTGVNQYGPLRLGPHYVETAQINGEVIEAYPIWCIQALYADPGPNQMTDIATLTDSRKLGPAELALETPQAEVTLE